MVKRRTSVYNVQTTYESPCLILYERGHSAVHVLSDVPRVVVVTGPEGALIVWIPPIHPTSTTRVTPRHPVTPPFQSSPSLFSHKHSLTSLHHLLHLSLHHPRVTTPWSTPWGLPIQPHLLQLAPVPPPPSLRRCVRLSVCGFVLHLTLQTLEQANSHHITSVEHEVGSSGPT